MTLARKGIRACVYVTSVFKSENVQVRLLTSISHIAPLEEITILRLEFLGNLLVTRIINIIETSLLEKEIKFEQLIYWVDSDISPSR